VTGKVLEAPKQLNTPTSQWSLISGIMVQRDFTFSSMTCLPQMHNAYCLTN